MIFSQIIFHLFVLLGRTTVRVRILSFYYLVDYSSFDKLRVAPLRSLNPERQYCSVAIATDDAHSYAQHLSLWHHVISHALTSLFPAIHPMLQRNQRRYHVKTHLNTFKIYTSHPVVLVPSTGSREGDFDGCGVVWIVSVYTVLVRGSE
jgi:hypothetical protein